MALKTSVDNTEKLGPVTVVQTAITADSADNDVTSAATSGATSLVSFQVVNGSKVGFYIKFYDSSTASSSNYPILCLYVASATTQFVGFSRGVPFSTAISVICTTSIGTGNGSALTGTSSYTLIASDSATY